MANFIKDLLNPLRSSISTLSSRSVSVLLAGRDGIAASVLVVTRNRSSFLNLTLAALEKQNFPASAWETIVINNASSDDTLGILKCYQQRDRFQLIKQDLPQQHTFTDALNGAVKVARGRIAIFVGEGCLVAPDFLLQHLAHHVNKERLVLGNSQRYIHTHLFSPLDPVMLGVSPRCVLQPEDLQNADRLGTLIFETSPQKHPTGNEILLRTRFNVGNVSLPKEQFLAANGFDQDLFDELRSQLELAYRIHQNRLHFCFEENAVALQQFYPFDSIERANEGHAVRAFFHRHPELDPDSYSPVWG